MHTMQTRDEGASLGCGGSTLLDWIHVHDIDLSFGCSISPALLAEGTVQDSSHCQGREEVVISKECRCSPAEAHSEQTAHLEHRHNHERGGFLQEGGVGSKKREKPNRKIKIMWQLQEMLNLSLSLSLFLKLWLLLPWPCWKVNHCAALFLQMQGVH